MNVDDERTRKADKYLVEVYLNRHLIHFVIVQHLFAILGLACRKRVKKIVLNASYNWNE